MVEPATIRSLFLKPLANAAGNDRAIGKLLSDHGFFPAHVATPYAHVPLHAYVALIEDAAARLKRPFIGLEMAEAFSLSDLGPFHAVFSAAGTLREAFASFARFQAAWQTWTSLSSTRECGETTVRYRIDDAAIWPRRQDAEFTVAGIVKLLRDMGPSDWSPLAVHFEHSVTGRESRLSQHFRAPVLGNKPANALVLADAELDRRLDPSPARENQELRSTLEEHLLDLMRIEHPKPRSARSQTAEIIASRLGHAPVHGWQVAAELNLSPRSLRRRLAAEGTCFRDLLQEARQSRASAILPDQPIAKAAERLGYSSMSTFSRAFKGWTGASPSRYARGD